MRVYEECTDLARLGKLMDDYIDDYNLAHSTPMTLVFFKDALEFLEDEICDIPHVASYYSLFLAHAIAAGLVPPGACSFS